MPTFKCLVRFLFIKRDNACSLSTSAHSLTLAERPGEPPERAPDAPLAGRGAAAAVVLCLRRRRWLVEPELERLRVEVDLLLGLVPRQREGGDAVDARDHVPLPQARSPRLAPGIHLQVENVSLDSMHIHDIFQLKL